MEFLDTKDGNLTCKLNSVFMHSAYSPLKEAERFAENIKAPFDPEIIFIIEPCISYCAKYIKDKFPKTKICAIRLSDLFVKYDKNFDQVFYLNQFSSSEILCDKLYNRFGENTLAYSLILSWDPSARVFQDEVFDILKSYKSLIQKCHSILRTRSFFEKKWIQNTFNIISNIKNLVSFSKKGNSPVIVCASGPSLENAIPLIKRSNFFVLAVSSAITPLLKNGITPDLCLSTDGGFWANKHLEILRKYPDIKLALAVEGNCPKTILNKSHILPLTYSDGVESDIYKNTGIPSYEALRCGTVSGTAMDFAKKITTGNIYFAGLDLHTAKGFQHLQPNALEKSPASTDCRISSKEKRLSSLSFSNQAESLKIYEDWFKNSVTEKDLTSRRFFRIIEKAGNSLGFIKDISCDEFENLIKEEKDFQKPEFSTTIIPENDLKSSMGNAEAFIKKHGSSEEWKKNVFVSDYLNYMHTYDENLKEALKIKIEKQNTELLEKLCRQFTKK